VPPPVEPNRPAGDKRQQGDQGKENRL